jgi:hypothetical protein
MPRYFLLALFLGLQLPIFASAAEIDFAHEIAPLIKQRCAKCHTGQEKQGSLSLNTRESLVKGGESGPAVVPGKSGASELIRRLTSEDPDLRMPPEGSPLSTQEIARLKSWIDAGAPWENGFTFAPRAYEPPLTPRKPELPPAMVGREHPVDRLIDAYLAKQKVPQPGTIDDSIFARRAFLDLIGLLPTPEELHSFLANRSPKRREQLITSLLARDVDYAEHWLTFWNDLLRNDYTGTGFITGGRKQITRWLYASLVENKPYDQFVRELIAPPTNESRGFIEGIKWRGNVSAGQTVEIQFAQSVGQSLLGINLKCASCHDSFIDRWKLEESYGLAAIYASVPLDIHRCDKPTSQVAKAAWLFPELGQIDPQAAQPERLKQLAALLTHPENGRLTRTIVNRLWHRLMGRGIVHPTDAMQTEPWNADLLDYLAWHLAENGYDLKKTLALVATSQAYQSRTQAVEHAVDDDGYVYAGPRARRLTAEQFVDVVWQLTAAAPTRYDAAVVRGKPDPSAVVDSLASKWVWSRAETSQSPASETITLRKRWQLKQVPTQAIAVIACDNQYVLHVNGQRIQEGEDWQRPDLAVFTPRLKAGENEVVIVATNGGSGPNPAAMFFEGRLRFADGTTETWPLDETWQWSSTRPNANGKYREEPSDWQPAVEIANPELWSKPLQGSLASLLAQGDQSSRLMVRASLVKSDFLMRSLGRPNRDQIVTVRPDELTTLEAIDLSNGQILADTLARGAKHLLARKWESSEAFVRWLFQFALSREPTASELSVLVPSPGTKLSDQDVQDILWSIIMLPEFQLVR